MQHPLQKFNFISQSQGDMLRYYLRHKLKNKLRARPGQASLANLIKFAVSSGLSMGNSCFLPCQNAATLFTLQLKGLCVSELTTLLCLQHHLLSLLQHTLCTHREDVYIIPLRKVKIILWYIVLHSKYHSHTAFKTQYIHI